ncbi:hypothetical protein RND81_07G110400 [Saponaria officinalis]|uniref:Epidermal patterning factor-like protein n=1 Tax=Saponaria officinalis TaxID=3572 RepID=A0AAW1JP54_SAPOF
MVFLAIFLVLPSIISSRHLNRPRYCNGHNLGPPINTSNRATKSYRQPLTVLVGLNPRQGAQPKMLVNPRPRARARPVPKSKGLGPDTEIAGSSLPDCSHACGSSTPCRLVMVSFVCAALEETETCPMAYKCMCNNKSYPVP